MGTRGRHGTIIAAVLGGALLLAGCGSSGGSGGAGSTPSSATGSTPSSAPTTAASSGVTKADYIKQANGVCRSYSVKASSLPTPAGSSDVAGASKTLLATADLADQQISALEALKRPAADSAKLGALYAGTRKLVARLRTDGTKLKAGDTAAITDVQSLSTAIDTDNKGYDNYGLGTCGSSS